MGMKRVILGLLILGRAMGATENARVDVHLGTISVIGTETNVWFLCNVTIENRTKVPLTTTNLFLRFPGLALKITDSNDKELKSTYAVPLHASTWTFPPQSPRTFKLSYGVPGISGSYHYPGISLPGNARTVRLHIEGTLSGSSYSGGITSNIVEVKIP